MFEMAEKEHCMDILIEVNKRVAEEFQSKDGLKQVPETVSMLTHKLFFSPGEYTSDPGERRYKSDVYKMTSKPRGTGEPYIVKILNSINGSFTMCM